MALPENLLECLHIKKVEMAAEMNISEDGMKAYVVIFPIEEKKEQKYKNNLAPIISYEIRLIKHNVKYIDERYGFDYDYALEDNSTRIKRIFVNRSNDNHELERELTSLDIDINNFSRIRNYDSALIGNPIESYIKNTDELSHLWKDF